MRRLRWTLSAADDLAQIRTYLAEHNPQFCESTIQKIAERLRSLRTSPALGRPSRPADMRELVLAPLPYVIVYRVRTNAIEVVRIRHGARKWN